jgi:hypothetical protein
MSQSVCATFVDGVLKPDLPLALPTRTRVRVTIDPIDQPELPEDPIQPELDQIWAELDLDSGGLPPSRSKLHRLQN